MPETMGLIIAMLGTTEIVIIAIVVLILFGGRKIPELMKGVGKGVRGFKDGLKEVEDEVNTTGDDAKKDR